jgi:hypothetical protein
LDDYNEDSDMRDQGVPGGDIWDPLKTYSLNQAVSAYDPVEPFTDRAYRSLIDDNTGNDPLNNPVAWQLEWVEDNSRNVDPRLDWTVGRRGIPYWDWGVHTGSDWIRDQTYAGPYSPKKQVYKKSEEGTYTEVGGWTGGWTANGYRMIRYAEVLLLLAECQINLGDLDGARQNINQVRSRAANPDGFVKESDGITSASNYVIGEYLAAVFPFDNANNALKALARERKLELGMEGHRWFDLNRWGNTVIELNRALDYEKNMPWGRATYGDASVGSEDTSYPIPQRQIDISNEVLVQIDGH